ncbi:MAG TPA: ATP-binding protein [Thermohalobaculum sp.]|nr:ATP-binding protein [Thermohalobaculum sp.]
MTLPVDHCSSLAVSAGGLQIEQSNQFLRPGRSHARCWWNAIKHHDLLHGEIVVLGTMQGSECEFRVKDDGPGIEPKFRDRVFEIFKTLHPRDEVEGSGMGLSIVQKTVEQHSGRIWIEDNGDARGACFVFTVTLGRQNV